MKTQCVHCRAILQVPDEFVGRRGRCPKCGQTFTISPQPETESPAGPAGWDLPEKPGPDGQDEAGPADSLTGWDLPGDPGTSATAHTPEKRESPFGRDGSRVVKARLVVLLSGSLLLAIAVLILGVALATHQRLGPLAITAAQLGVVAFYWFPWSMAWQFRPTVLATVCAIISLAVSLTIIGLSLAMLKDLPVPFFMWGPFLMVHVAANIALALRPQVYLRWMLGVWIVVPLAVVVLSFLMWPLTLLIPTSGLEQAIGGLCRPFDPPIRAGFRDIDERIFCMFCVLSFAGTAAGLGLAWAWRRRRLVKDRGPGAHGGKASVWRNAVAP